MENKEIYKKLANQIYELDEKVYKASGSNLGKTFTGEKVRTIENLTMLITSNPQGHLLRSEMALIGNMARSIRDKQVRHDLLIEYNSILEEIANLPKSFGSVDIVDEDLADMNSSILSKNFSEKDHLVICISRSHGSAGTDIGFALAEALHINYYDEAVLNQILERRDVKEFGPDASKISSFNRYHGLSKKDASFFRQSALIWVRKISCWFVTHLCRFFFSICVTGVGILTVGDDCLCMVAAGCQILLCHKNRRSFYFVCRINCRSIAHFF